MSAVPDLLERGRNAPETVSALEAVMGEDWAVVGFDQARKPRPIPGGLVAKHREDVSRRSASSLGGALRPGSRPQAVVKMVRKGGASDLRGLQTQMAYLSRDGAQPLQRSERYMGVEIDADERAALEAGWQMPPEGSGKADRTSHFIVSFPQEADHAAAERAGRAWAEQLFGSGDYGGDAFDYYTAFHTDRDHPHMHVVVHRRGLDHGAWLKVSRRSDLNYDAMRSTLVHVAAREGIELEATNRYERALHDRPVPDAEYRRAQDENRAAVAPAHTRQSAILAAAALIHHARRFAREARRVERDAPDQAALLRRLSDDMARGKVLCEQSYEKPAAGQEMQGMSQGLDETRGEVRANFEMLDRTAAQLEPGAERVRVERRIAELKAQSARAIGLGRTDLRDYREPDPSGRYQGLAASAEADPSARAIWADTEAQVRLVAARYGVDADATVERYSGGPLSIGLARRYAEGEANERARSRADGGEPRETPAEREAALATMHGEIGAIYTRARDPGTGRDQGDLVDGTRGAEAGNEDQYGRHPVKPTREANRDRPDQRTAPAPTRRAQEGAREAPAREDWTESETERWIRERETREARDRDGGRGL